MISSGGMKAPPRGARAVEQFGYGVATERELEAGTLDRQTHERKHDQRAARRLDGAERRAGVLADQVEVGRAREGADCHGPTAHEREHRREEHESPETEHRVDRCGETQPQRDHVAVPELAPHAGDEAQRAWIGQGLAVEVGQQGRRRLVVADEIAAIDIAIAHPVLQWDAPLPAGRARRGAGVGVQVR